MTVTFFWHHDAVCTKTLIDRVSVCIEALISNGATDFYLGGYGNFDTLAAKIVFSMKKRNPAIKSVLVIPYLDRNYDMSWYDGSVYPPLENVPKRYAISKRNEWMINQSDIVVAYIRHNFGGAAASVSYAKRRGKRVIFLDCNSPATPDFSQELAFFGKL